MTHRRIGQIELLQLLGDWSSGSGPLYKQLADAIRKLIDVGDLRPGTRLPSERALSSTLAVARSTVVAALDHLKQTGYLDSAPGSGTWVRALRGFNPAGGVLTPADTVGRNPLYTRLDAPPSDDLVDFTVAVVDATPSVTAAIDRASRELAASLDGSGYFPSGWPPLQEAVAAWFTRRGLPTEPSEILITNGGQQAIMLVAAAYVQPGDPVVMETPSFPGALDAFRMLGASVRAVPVRPTGLEADDVVEAIDARRAVIAYLIPTYQNPTGRVMSHLERKRLARYLDSRSTVLVEDEAMVALTLEGDAPPPPIAAYHDGGLVIGSASKPFWGGLRVGWIRGRSDLIRRLRHYKMVFDLSSPILPQAAACLMFEEMEEILAYRRQQLLEARATLEEGLSGLLPEWTWERSSGGLTLWVQIPEGSATELAQLAMRHGVAVIPGPFFDPQALHDTSLRLPYVLPPDEIERGIARLAEAWNRYRGLPALRSIRPA